MPLLPPAAAAVVAGAAVVAIAAAAVAAAAAAVAAAVAAAPATAFAAARNNARWRENVCPVGKIGGDAAVSIARALGVPSLSPALFWHNRS